MYKMKKKFLALALVLVLCLSLAVPAFAAERPEKEDAGIVGCYTITRSGSDAGQFVESSIELDFGGFADEIETIHGYQPIAADTTWTITNTSKEENSYLNISIRFYEKFENESSFILGNICCLRKDGSFVHVSFGDDDPEQINLYSGQSVTFSIADAVEYQGTDVPENVIYCLKIVQYHPDNDEYEEADYYYKLGTQSPEPADPSAQYTDLVPGAWYKDAVNYVLTNKLFQGMTDTIFAPDATMNRAMFVVVLARKDGVSDESGASWYEKDVQWAVSKGYYDGKNPEEAIPRQEMALMLYRHAGSPKVSGSLDGFTDASSVSASVRDAFIWAVQNGYINGIGGRLAPTETATRAQVATIFMRVFG